MKQLELFILIAAFMMMPSITQAADESDPTGIWQWSNLRKVDKVDVTLKLKFVEAKLSGSIQGTNNKEKEIEGATFKEGEVAFTVTRTPMDGKKVTAKYKGKLEGDTIKGKVEIKYEGKTTIRDWQATREKS